MISIGNTIHTSFTAIWTNKLRSFLTTLGVVIGVGSVVLLIGIGNGLQSYITEQFNDLGANTIQVMPGDSFDQGGSSGFSNPDSQIAAYANNKLKLSDATDLKKLGAPIQSVAAMAQGSALVSFKSEEITAPIVGTENTYEVIMNTKAASGKWFSVADDNSRRRVAVIGPEVQKEIFGGVDPIGKTIKVSGQSFKVVGVAEDKGGGMGGPTFNLYVFIPLQTYFDLFDNTQIQAITIKVDDKDNIPRAEEMIENQLLKRLNEDEFSVFQTTEILEVINQVLGTLTIGLGAIAAISLVVGGIGIMNIMLVSVTERTREIGLRKAIGATPNVILFQFLIEAVLLSVLGGFIGVAIAFLLSLLISNFFPAQISVEAVILAFSVSSAIGIIFGVAPARRASRLSPIEALRYE